MYEGSLTRSRAVILPPPHKYSQYLIQRVEKYKYYKNIMFEIVRHLRYIKIHNTLEAGPTSMNSYSAGTVGRDQFQSHLMTDVNPAYETLCIFNMVPKVMDSVHYIINIKKRSLSQIFRRPLHSSMEHPLH
jgi:hypothetical protein